MKIRLRYPGVVMPFTEYLKFYLRKAQVVKNFGRDLPFPCPKLTSPHEKNPHR